MIPLSEVPHATRQFTEEFKHEAVKLARQPGSSKAAIARDLGIGANMLGRWIREREPGSTTASRSSPISVCSQEFERMRRELAKVKMERDILKKALGYFAADPKWAADFTYVWTAEGWLFVAVVLDLYSRRVVGWSMQSTMTARLVMDALLMAIFRRGRPKAVLHHSDQGSQYTSEDFQRLLDSHGILCSMSRRGNCWDNAAMESFFSTLKTERLSRRIYRTRDELRADVFDYIEPFYNPRRRHSTLGYVSPMQFEDLQCA